MTTPTSFLGKIIGRTAATWAMLPMVPPEEGAGGSAASGFRDSEVQSFAKAAVRVQMISDAYSQKMGETRSDAEKKQLQRRASSEMVQAVKNEGLSVDRYQDIAKRVDTDPDLARRIRDKLSNAA